MFIEKITLTDDPQVTLTAYVCEPSTEMRNMDVRPAMLVLPGGGYSICSDREAEPIAFEYISKGFNAFILRYSLKEKSAFPTPLNDAVAALKLIRKNSEKWHIDPDKVAVIGFSAGGHLAAALSTMSEEKPNACLLGYPCILEKIGKILAKPIPDIAQQVTDKTPPTFIFSASNDGLVPIENSLEYALALSKNNVPFELHVFECGNHGFSTATRVVISDESAVNENKPVTYWVERSVEWLNKLFGYGK